MAATSRRPQGYIARLIRSSAVAVTTAVACVPSSPTWAVSCLAVVKVEAWDFLNIRAKPDHTSEIVAAIAPGSSAVLWPSGPCIPRAEARSRRWCPVEYYPLPNVVRTGFVKAYFTQAVDCPAFRPRGADPVVAATRPDPPAPPPAGAADTLLIPAGAVGSVPMAQPTSVPPAAEGRTDVAADAGAGQPAVPAPADVAPPNVTRIDLTRPPEGVEAAPGIFLKPFPLPAAVTDGPAVGAPQAIP